MPSYVDTHCHLDHHDQLVAAEQVRRAHDAGIDTMITVGTDMASSAQAVRTAHRFDGVWAVVGVHPNDAMEATPRVMQVIERLAREQDVVGVGETGLDYYRDHTTPEQQAAAFRLHVDLARELDKTLVVHCREAWDDCLALLDEHGAPERVVMHCFSGSTDVVDHCASRGWFMSFAGNVTFRNAEELRTAAARVPRELLLTETDSPFLAPHPHRGERNDPSYVPLVTAQLAELHDLDVEQMSDTVERNARRAFALPAPVAHSRAS